ncbi:AAA family ATPase [Dawidia soli]|uniref:AAA family ATPase n=1 Tax=Dawidia soli TaxID=2782352 RepID=A0AAP2DBG6_9BACT|nr:AAA family ATPase [Dawidia soli]MBT1688874.1 AAA family ATPase [Dawidia soli]
MAHFFEFVHIKNFRSIRDCKLTDLRKFNIIIGRPDTGKTNLIDALTLLSIPGLQCSTLELLRASKIDDLFYCFDKNNPGSVVTNKGQCEFQCHADRALTIDLSFVPNKKLTYILDERSQERMETRHLTALGIKRYQYNLDATYLLDDNSELSLPFGENLFSVVRLNTDLCTRLTRLLEESRVVLATDPVGTVVPCLPLNSGGITKMPYRSIGSTLQRMIFYFAAIMSNRNQIILFDNIDAGMFPNFLSPLAAEMMDSENQYFFSTHSPFILDDFLQEDWKNIAVFMAYRTEEGTNVRRLTEEDLRSIYSYGVDAFTNSEYFVPDRK